MTTLDELLATIQNLADPSDFTDPNIIVLGDGQKLVTVAATANGDFGIGFFTHEEAYSKADVGRVLTDEEAKNLGIPDYVLDITNKKALLILKSVIDSVLVMYDDITNPNLSVKIAAIKAHRDIHDNIYVV